MSEIKLLTDLFQQTSADLQVMLRNQTTMLKDAEGYVDYIGISKDNQKVLKVPRIEQKIIDDTSNELCCFGDLTDPI